MRRRFLAVGAALLTVPALVAQQAPRANTDALTKPFQLQAYSSISYSGGKDGDQTVEISNVAFEVSGDSVAGRPPGSRLMMRTSTRSKQVLGDQGIDSTVTIEAWPLGGDLKQKPLYTVNVPGVGARTMYDGVWLVDRSLGEVSWWSVYKLGTGQHLFDTYVDVLRFPLSRSDGSDRYAGLEVPPDDVADARLKEPHVVGVLTYASNEKVIREVLITCADAKEAQDLCSYADTMRTLKSVEQASGRAISISFENAYPSPANATLVSVPIVKDDLDVAHATLPAGLRATAWQR